MKIKDMITYAVLIAILLLMSFTPLGYLHIGAVEITLLMIPVTVGAELLGVRGGAILGGIFGLTSFSQCFGMSLFGTTLFGVNPFFAFLMCVPTRVLAGILCALCFRALRRYKTVSFFLSGIAGTLANTVLFVGTMLLLFGTSDYITGMRGGLPLLSFIAVFVGLNGVVELIANAIIGPAIAKAITLARR